MLSLCFFLFFFFFFFNDTAPTEIYPLPLHDALPIFRRIGLCWEATRAPRRTRKPQAWAISVAQAGLLRVRRQSEKSIVKLTSKTNRKVSYASTPKETFTLNQYSLVRSFCPFYSG